MAHCLCRKWFLDWFWRQRRFDAKEGIAVVWRVWAKLGRCPSITSGVKLSWVRGPLGPWSLEWVKGCLAGTWSRPALEAQWLVRGNYRSINRINLLIDGMNRVINCMNLFINGITRLLDGGGSLGPPHLPPLQLAIPLPVAAPGPWPGPQPLVSRVMP